MRMFWEDLRSHCYLWLSLNKFTLVQLFCVISCCMVCAFVCCSETCFVLFSDLGRMYMLVSRISDGLGELKTLLETHIYTQGQAAIERCGDSALNVSWTLPHTHKRELNMGLKVGLSHRPIRRILPQTHK